MPVPGGTQGDWRVGLLEALGAPVNNLNVDALEWWAASEGMPDWENNWLATTIGGYGGVVVNSAGVKRYPTVADGVAATAATLAYGAYANVVRALRTGTSLEEIWSAINSSPWCSRCQNGLYPVVLFDNLHAVPPPGPPPNYTAPPPAPPAPGQDRASTAWGYIQLAAGRQSTVQMGELSAVISYTRKSRK